MATVTCGKCGETLDFGGDWVAVPDPAVVELAAEMRERGLLESTAAQPETPATYPSCAEHEEDCENCASAGRWAEMVDLKNYWQKSAAEHSRRTSKKIAVIVELRAELAAANERCKSCNDKGWIEDPDGGGECHCKIGLALEECHGENKGLRAREAELDKRVVQVKAAHNVSVEFCDKLRADLAAANERAGKAKKDRVDLLAELDYRASMIKSLQSRIANLTAPAADALPKCPKCGEWKQNQLSGYISCRCSDTRYGDEAWRIRCAGMSKPATDHLKQARKAANKSETLTAVSNLIFHLEALRRGRER